MLLPGWPVAIGGHFLLETSNRQVVGSPECVVAARRPGDVIKARHVTE
jgi:hypothetical protein